MVDILLIYAQSFDVSDAAGLAKIFLSSKIATKEDATHCIFYHAEDRHRQSGARTLLRGIRGSGEKLRTVRPGGGEASAG